MLLKEKVEPTLGGMKLVGEKNLKLAARLQDGGTVFYAGSAFGGSGHVGVVGAIKASNGSPVAGFGTGGLFTFPQANTSFNGLLLAADGKLRRRALAPARDRARVR